MARTPTLKVIDRENNRTILTLDDKDPATLLANVRESTSAPARLKIAFAAPLEAGWDFREAMKDDGPSYTGAVGIVCEFRLEMN